MWGTFGEKAGGLGNRGPGISVSPRDFFCELCVVFLRPLLDILRYMVCIRSSLLRHSCRSQILICRVYSCKSYKNWWLSSLLLEAGKQNVVMKDFFVRVMLKFCWQTWNLVITLWITTFQTDFIWKPLPFLNCTALWTFPWLDAAIVLWLLSQ